MSRSIYVAAGGGGDALASLMLAPAGPASAPIVLSYSWDRYLIDPNPGPRTPADFQGLARLTRNCWEVTPESSLPAGGVSGLTLLARHAEARFVLIDPGGGAEGIRVQISELLDHFRADDLVLVDVGGDVAAHGTESTLLSPLADALTLAAVATAEAPATVAILGPGLDGELPAHQVRDDLTRAGAKQLRLRPSDVDPHLSCLNVHPSEATLLVAAAAKGLHGRAEIRDKGALVTLSSGSADMFLLPAVAVLEINEVAAALTGTHSFGDAERRTEAICGRTELDHERRKAAALAHGRPAEPTAAELRRLATDYCAAAARRGVDLITFRKLTEAIGKHHYDPPAVRELVGALAFPDLPLLRTCHDWRSVS